jgi:hypothetical protein
MALKELKNLGLSETKSVFWVTTNSEDPDDACSEAGDKVYHMIAKQRDTTRYKEAAAIVKEKMKIIKIIKV